MSNSITALTHCAFWKLRRKDKVFNYIPDTMILNLLIAKNVAFLTITMLRLIAEPLYTCE